ncbi:class I SAM-dependent methyltransferase [Nonlabens sp. Ci31]|uniref:class I SAM-dependent methyltransferase n=1 Tax=Nonlabens sp. Ci31 TaxID=2608253 RepID=UPI0014649301|nr:class I SAM-dependent methyltransferase [Nonlabens sp. Ci31]QJP33002.1 class I SAM-dependent methyltransferase [Nonlabens sp. Ci31]
MNTCPLCLSVQNELLHTNSRGDKYLENYVCDNCGFIYTYPRISNDEIDNLYLKGEFSMDARKSYKPDLAKFIQTETWALERLHILEQKLPDFFSTKKKCLEIGSGASSFLWLLKSRGHLVKGIEPDTNFVNVAIDRYDIDVDTLLFDENYKSEPLDFICNFHVIEHVLDPRIFVKNMYSILKDDGLIYIECPTIDDIYTKSLDTFFWDVHVNTFSNVSLAWLLESEGFLINDLFMHRGFVGVIATKGTELKYAPDSKERVLNLIKEFYKTNSKIQIKLSLKKRVVGMLKRILDKI